MTNQNNPNDQNKMKPQQHQPQSGQQSGQQQRQSGQQSGGQPANPGQQNIDRENQKSGQKDQQR